MWVGSALLALLFIADWYWPDVAATPAQEAATQALPASDFGLRIQSERKWPDKVVFDTTIPTITPPTPVVTAETAPSAPAVAAAAVAPSSLDARAELKQVVQPVPPLRRQAKVRHRSARPAASTWASANPNSGWSWNW